eukprot:4676482-Amphidinium_carterae.1
MKTALMLPLRTILTFAFQQSWSSRSMSAPPSDALCCKSECHMETTLERIPDCVALRALQVFWALRDGLDLVLSKS